MPRGRPKKTQPLTAKTEAHAVNVKPQKTVTKAKATRELTEEQKAELLVEKWGQTFTGEELKFAEKKYEVLSVGISPTDVFKTELVLSIVRSMVMQNRALDEGDIDKYDKLGKLIQTTMKNAGLSPEKAVANAAADSLLVYGQMIADIENFCPAEIYKDKTVLADTDGFDAYHKRFFARAYENFFLGKRDEDEELKVTREEDGGLD